MHQTYLSQTYENRKSRLTFLKKFKTLCLTASLTSSCIAIMISLSIPLTKNESKFQLPNQVSLKTWQLNSSNDLQQAIQNGALSAKRYSYSSATQSDLRVDALYINGVVSIPQSLEIIGLKYPSNKLRVSYLEKVGYYALFFDQERAYLSSCINSNGFTTVTEDQFIRHRPLELNFSHISGYLIGTRDLFDSRCLFTTLSIPIDKNNMVNSQTIYMDKNAKTLEQAWIAWHHNWKDHFPIKLDQSAPITSLVLSIK